MPDSCQIVPFNFEGHPVRTFTGADGVPWSVAKDVAKVLGYANTKQAIIDHCKAAEPDGVTIRDAIGRMQSMTIIPERDVYRLIMRSRIPAAA